MTKLQIEIEDIFSQEEIKSIAEQEFRQHLRLSNWDISHAFKIICVEKINQLIPDFESILENKLKKLIENDIKTWNIITWDDETCNPKNGGAKIVDEFLFKNKDAIENKILEIIKNDMKDEVGEKIRQNLEDLERFVTLLRKAISNEKKIDEICKLAKSID